MNIVDERYIEDFSIEELEAELIRRAYLYYDEDVLFGSSTS